MKQSTQRKSNLIGLRRLQILVEFVNNGDLEGQGQTSQLNVNFYSRPPSIPSFFHQYVSLRVYVTEFLL